MFGNKTLFLVWVYVIFVDKDNEPCFTKDKNLGKKNPELLNMKHKNRSFILRNTDKWTVSFSFQVPNSYKDVVTNGNVPDIFDIGVSVDEYKDDWWTSLHRSQSIPRKEMLWRERTAGLVQSSQGSVATSKRHIRKH